MVERERRGDGRRRRHRDDARAGAGAAPPDQPVNVEPVAGVAVSVTIVP